MKKYVSVFALIFALLLLSACQPAAESTPATAPTAAQSVTNAPAAEPVLTLVGPQGSKSLSLDDLKTLPAAEGQAGIKSSTGKIFPPAAFKGVLLTDLVKLVGAADPSMGVQIEAKDGYAMTFSFDQLTKGTFIAYDPATGDETKNAGNLRALIAYESEGKPLNPDTDGVLRLVVISDKNNQVTDGHWSVKFINKITLKSVAEDWSLELQGAINDSVDRGSFESCSTGKCHQAAWQDDKSQVWSGTPLWLIVGRVDDDKKHDTGAFNADLAKAGYMIEIIGKDGYSIKLDSGKVANNKNILVANQMNSNALTDKDFPLKLVGSDLTKKEMVGGIAKIILHLGQQAAPAVQPTTPPQPTAAAVPTAASPAAAGNTSLSFTGLVGNEKTWTLDDLKKMNPVTLTVEQPKKGQVEVTGVYMNALLDLVAPKPEAKTLVITAVDNYKVEVALTDVRACPKALIAFNDAGGLNTVFPDLPGNTWVKNVAKIEVK